MIPQDIRILESGSPIERASLAAILIHGRGGNAEDMAELAVRIGIPSIHYVLPQATKNSWYPFRFTDPPSVNEPALSQSFACCESLVQDVLRRGVPADRIVIGGFSQGACITAEFLMRHPRRYAVAFVLTGGLFGPLGTTWRPSTMLSGVPVYMSSSEIDEWIPVWRFKESAEALTACGADVRADLFPARTHLVCDEEIGVIREMLSRCISAPESNQ